MSRVRAFVRNGMEVLRHGGLDTGELPAPYQVVARRPGYRLRHYSAPLTGIAGAAEPAAAVAAGGTTGPGAAVAAGRTAGAGGPPVLLVPPLMLAAEVYDVAPSASAVTLLRAHGTDPWVVDFGAPGRVPGGLAGTMSDHVLAVAEAVGLVRAATGREVHLAGYSQGGMVAYQAAAYLRSAGVASVVTFGSPVDTVAALPFGLPRPLVVRGAALLARYLFPYWTVPAWATRLGFRMLDPVRTVRTSLRLLSRLHDRTALLPREHLRRFLARDGWVAWSGPAMAELLLQVVVHNRMASGGLVVGGRPVTLADLSCPVLRFVGERDKIGRPASVRGIDRAAPHAANHEVTLRAGHFGLVVGSRARAVTWPTTAAWARWCDGDGELPAHVLPAAPVVNAVPGSPAGRPVRLGESRPSSGGA